ncbi:metal ABC transporter ATP-binding protein [Paracandidimonas soli]|uniref:Zinc/manganese transport system ATP-binding protein n=1 Tax=Paracandidimonas soli TaxID=1917182 RepID=A0A4R3VIU2_9BURK|nr:metal ABC transporter ATP-binding protein [Paracandidimonas soli]TCV02895.1 zinc/manganese transport system ATP-binding protein [Paracandidimonas soli]
MTHAVIELDQVSLGWRGRVAVRDVSGRFAPGSLTAIVGPNGAGKSTLIKGVMGLIAPLRGYIRLAPHLRNSVACLPQVGDLDRSFPISVYDLVGMGGWSRTGAWRGLDDSEHARIEQALEAVGLADFSRRGIGTLSGGQLQRALFARLLMSDADILLLDEPFAAVDQATTEELMQLLCRLNEQGRTIAVVLHDLELARQYFPQTLLLAGQAVAWGETANVLTPENLHLARHLCAGDFL